MGGIIGGGKSRPVVQQVEAPTVAATPPEPEQVAEKVENKKEYVDETTAKRKGTSALRINLNVGGQGLNNNAYGRSNTNGLVIPK